MTKKASPELEAFINEAIRQCAKVHYFPTTFQGMRHRHGTVEAMERLVFSPDIQKGFKRLQKEGLLDWSVESGITKFAGEFSKNAQECAEFRLRMARKGE